jgi:hypothetical protein
MTTPLLLSVACVYLAGLALLAYVTRAPRRRFVGALVGGAAVAAVGVGVEGLCQSLGLWHYPSVAGRYGPPAMYPVIFLMWAGYSLIGWRVARRFGGRGEIVFLAAIAIAGTLRDFAIAWLMPGVIVFSPGAAIVVIDLLCWFGLTALALGMMRMVAGPAASDLLASRAWLPTGR